MAFGARQHDDGSWRICERKGRTILYVCSEKYPDIQIRFARRADCEKCCKELNERFWPAYAKDRQFTSDVNVQWAMLDTILKHGGITREEYKRMEKP